MQDQQNERVWEERRRQLLEREWSMARALHDKAAEMLAVALKEARWSVRDIAAFFEISSNLARRSTGLEGDSAIKQQLNLAYELMRKLLTIEDSANASTVKGLVYAHLESVLLQLGRPIKEVTSVLNETETEADFETDFEVDDQSDR